MEVNYRAGFLSYVCRQQMTKRRPVRYFRQLIFFTGVGLVASCSQPSDMVDSQGKLTQEVVIEDFEGIFVPLNVFKFNGEMDLVEAPKGMSGKALQVKLHTQENESAGIAMVTLTSYDWGEYSDFNLAFDIANPGNESVQINLIIEDKSGAAYTRGFVVPVGDTTTVYAKMDGHDQVDPENARPNEFNFSSGLRSNPATWQSTDRQAYSFWGNKRLDISNISRIIFMTDGNLSDRTITLDNIRLRPNPEMDPHFLTGLVDEFGQNAKVDYPNKVKSLAQLKDITAQELNSLKGDLMQDRSAYSGWKDGPKLNATGYFRTEKIDNKWTLVDPEGYLYFSTGIDIIRLSNSSTITGYDFDQNTIPVRSAEELLGEDDMPLRPVNLDAQKTRYVASEVRKNLFEWLPTYEDALGNHYGYRRETQSGPLAHGETFSFYSANLERKYGETTPESYLTKWREVTIDRMKDWGFTSLGNWAQSEFYKNKEIPFVAYADIIGDFDTIFSGFDFWHPVPDPYDPKFQERALAAAQHVAEQIQSSRWAMGVFFDNEQSFGRLDSDESHYGIVLSALSMDASKSKGKAAFSKILKDKYNTIESLNDAWDKDYVSWEYFDKTADPSINNDEQLADYSILLEDYGNQYFDTINQAMKSILPNHLYLGSRLPSWGMPMEILRAAAEHVDVITYNLYEEGLVPSKWAFLEEIDKPALIGEFSVGADDAGHVHPGIVISADQEDRGRMFKNYMYSVIDNPYFVGAHMFQYMDGPITGRAYDGENYNSGIVSVTDTPYKPLVDAARELNAELYERRFGALNDK